MVFKLLNTHNLGGLNHIISEEIILRANFADNLNDRQTECVKNTEGPTLVLAGAGSGKTRVLTHRVAYITKELNVPPYNILAITFTNKAADEMKQRLEAMLGGIDGMWVCTIHSMCNRILRQFGDRLGYTKAFSIYDEDDKRKVIKELIKPYKEDSKNDNTLREIISAISFAKNKNMSYRECLDNYVFGKNTDFYCDIYQKYEEKLRRSNALDFDDLVLKAYMLLKSDAESREYFQSKFKYIHIDEFQDTNILQYDLIKLLAEKHGNIFAVGDDDQSIYSFRGAEIENIFRFQKDFKDVKIFKLEQNYRSTKKILDIANRIISNNSNRMQKKLWTENGEGVRAERYDAFDEREEASYVRSVIQSLVRGYGYKYSDFAVLIRLNALSRSFEQEFNYANMPYKVYGGFKFYERKEIKDIIAYLRIIANPFDDESILRVINFPKRNIGESSVSRIREIAARHGIRLYDVITNPGKFDIAEALKGKLRAFAGVISQIMMYSQVLSMEEFIEKMLEISGIIRAFEEDTEENYNRRLNIKEFVNSFNEYFENNPQAQLEDFLTSVTLVSDIDEMEGDTISVATVHSVKGLEFNVVFVCGLEDGLFPIGRAYNSPQEIEEERRLMYVAVTRAKQRLYLTRAKSRFLYGDRSYMTQSLFLREIEGITGGGAQSGGIGPAGMAKSRIAEFKPSAVKENTEKDISRFKEGSKIIHGKFGRGVIVSLSGEGSNTIADIAFPNIGVKTFTLKFAPIELE